LALSIPAHASPGDLDADGRVTSADHQLLQLHLNGQFQLSPSQLLASDANGDGSITAADLPALRDLLLERFPPAVSSASPPNLGVVSPPESLNLTFNKRFHDDGNLAAGLLLKEAGPDRHLGTEDDVTIPAVVSASPPFLSYSPSSALSPGTYRFTASPPIADFQKRPMLPFAEMFLIPGDDPSRDSDFDGIPDPEEISNGTHPLLPDSDGDLADDLLEIQSGTDPNNPWSLPEDSGGKKVLRSLAVAYANLPGNASSGTPQDWILVISAITTYANLPPDAASTHTPASWTMVLSPIASYANLPANSDTSGTPLGWTTISSAIATYANLSVDAVSANTPVDWTSVLSPVVSYSNLNPESPDPQVSETVTVASAVVSYENS